jgi:DNA-binding MarR family transcriptional regulator
MGQQGQAFSSDRLRSAECACASVRRASRAVTQLYDTVLAPLAMKSTQFVVLRFLAEHGPTPQWKIAQENAVAVETLSRRLGALRTKGLIALEVVGARGEHIYRLTPRGKEAFEAAKPYWQRADNRLFQVLGREDAQRCVLALDRLAAGAHKAATLRTRNSSGTAT